VGRLGAGSASDPIGAVYGLSPASLSARSLVQRCGDAGRYNHGHAAADEIGCERRQTIHLVLRITILDLHVVAYDKAGFLQALEERGDFFDLVVIRIARGGPRSLARPAAAPAPPPATLPRPPAAE
jgi:hypothetical protein